MKKQEEAVGQTEEEETLEQCMARVKAENPEISDEDARAKCTAKPPTETSTEEKGFIDKLTLVFEEALDKKMDLMMKEIDKRIADAVKVKEDEAVNALKKGLGLDSDPVIHLSEMEGMVRKILLEKKPHGKRTETETTDKPIEGLEKAQKLEKADDMFNKMMQSKGGL